MSSVRPVPEKVQIGVPHAQHIRWKMAARHALHIVKIIDTRCVLILFDGSLKKINIALISNIYSKKEKFRLFGTEVAFLTNKISRLLGNQDPKFS